AAQQVLGVVRECPTRPSELLGLAAAVESEEVAGVVEAVVELVLLASLWAFAPDGGDVEEQGREVELLAAGLVADDDGAVLDVAGFRGADLLVAAAGAGRPAAESAALVSEAAT
ncbi:hypothetical protein M5002_10940, partial [Neisseria meningitidis]|nr:hypothetical protein [Neisseria meningitidis]